MDLAFAKEFVLLLVTALAYLLIVFALARAVAFAGQKIPRSAGAPVMAAVFMLFTALFIGEFTHWVMARDGSLTRSHWVAVCLIALIFLTGHAWGSKPYVSRSFLVGSALLYPLAVAFWIFLGPVVMSM